MNKGSKQTSTVSLPSYESAGIQNLLGQASNQTNQDIATANSPGVVGQIQGSSQNILNNQINPSSLTTPISNIANNNWTNPGTASSYMNPYESTALASQLNLDQQNVLAPELAQEQRSAAASGALGGSRSGIEQGMTTNQFNQNEMNQVAQGENTAYQTGEQQFNADQARQLAAQTQAAQTGISAANSNTYTNLASTQNSLEGIQAAESPGQQLATEAGIFGGVPGQQTVTGTTTQNPGSVWGGIATGLLGAAGDLLKGQSNQNQDQNGGDGLAEGGQMDIGPQLAEYLHWLDLHDIAEAVGA